MWTVAAAAQQDPVERGEIRVTLQAAGFDAIVATDLGYANAKAVAGRAPELAAVSELSEPMHMQLHYGNRTVVAMYDRADCSSLFYREAAGDVQTALGKPIGVTAAMARRFELSLADGLQIEVRVFAERGVNLHRSATLRAGRVARGEHELTVALCHTVTGSGFAAANTLTLWLDRNHDGHFGDGESQPMDLPFRVGDEGWRITGVDSAGAELTLVPFLEKTAAAPGFVFPDVRLVDLQGRHQALRDLRGKTVVLNLWARECVPCRMEMPQLDALARRHADDAEVVFVAVAPGSPEEIRDFLAKLQFGYLQFTRPVGDPLFERGFPWHFVLDAEGVVRWMAFGAAPSRDAEVDKVLASR